MKRRIIASVVAATALLATGSSGGKDSGGKDIIAACSSCQGEGFASKIDVRDDSYLPYKLK